jgi:hypothetical protein
MKKVNVARYCACFALTLLFVLCAHGQWSNPVNLGSAINTSYTEQMPSLSKNGLSLYFTSNRPCGVGDIILDVNIWVSQRESVDSGWSEPVCLDINVNAFQDSAASLSRDEHWMYFTSDRPGSMGSPGFNGRDIWISWRPHTKDDFGWTEPINAGPLLNSTYAEAGATFLADDCTGTSKLYFASNRGGINNADFNIWVSEQMPDGQFGTPSPVTELNTTGTEARPSVRFDGLEIFFFRIFSAGPVQRIYSARRSDPCGAWETPAALPAPMSVYTDESIPWIAADRRTLIFTSNRPGGVGGYDLWTTERPKEDIH